MRGEHIRGLIFSAVNEPSKRRSHFAEDDRHSRAEPCDVGGLATTDTDTERGKFFPHLHGTDEIRGVIDDGSLCYLASTDDGFPDE
jgi:hypothetical protein